MDSWLTNLSFGRLGDRGPVDMISDRLLTGRLPPVSGARDDRSTRAALLTALAARHLLDPTAITAAVIGDRMTVRLHTLALACYVPGVSHVAVAVLGDPADPALLSPRIGDELDLRSIELTPAASGAEAIVGANLVVIASPVPSTGPVADLGVPIHLAKGALLVNASGRDVLDTLLAEVTTVFADDLSLADAAAAQGFSRPKTAAERPDYRLTADLRQILRGEHPGRTGLDEVLLVELLSVTAPH